MNNRYTIAFRPHQNKSLTGTNIIYTYSGGIVTPINGNEPNYVEYDVTNSISQFNPEIVFDKLNQVNRQGDNGVSERFTVTNEAYTYINNYFFSTNWGHVNSIDVIVRDNESGSVIKEFILKADLCEIKPSEGCVMEITIKESNSKYDILSKADVFDNWQNWYSDTSSKAHPQFLTCIDKFGNSQRLALNLLWISAIPGLSLILNVVDEDDRIVRRNLGLQYYTSAPKVDDIINNVCAKAGLTSDTIFNLGKEYHNLCYISSNHDNFHKNDTSMGSPNLWFSQNNREATLFIDWLDALAETMACEWYIDGSVLFFKKLIDVYNEPVFYDFTNEKIYNIVDSFNGKRKNRRHGVVFGNDDGASSQINVLYSDVTNYDLSNNNPMLDGDNIINSTAFASTGFVRDGTTEDYIRQAIKSARTSALIYLVQIVTLGISLAGTIAFTAIAVIIAGFVSLWVIAILGEAIHWMNNYADFDGNDYTGAIRLSNTEQFNVGRLVMWEPSTPMNMAKVVATDNPNPDGYYNTQGYKQCYSLNEDDNNDSNNFGQNGTDYRAFNYPMYYDQKFTGNLAKEHESVFNPLHNNLACRDIEFTICKSPYLMQIFGLYINSTVKLRKKVKVYNKNGLPIYTLIDKITLHTGSNEIQFFGTIIYI